MLIVISLDLFVKSFVALIDVGNLAILAVGFLFALTFGVLLTSLVDPSMHFSRDASGPLSLPIHGSSSRRCPPRLHQRIEDHRSIIVRPWALLLIGTRRQTGPGVARLVLLLLMMVAIPIPSTLESHLQHRFVIGFMYLLPCKSSR